MVAVGRRSAGGQCAGRRVGGFGGPLLSFVLRGGRQVACCVLKKRRIEGEEERGGGGGGGGLRHIARYTCVVCACACEFAHTLLLLPLSVALFPHLSLHSPLCVSPSLSHHTVSRCAGATRRSISGEIPHRRAQEEDAAGFIHTHTFIQHSCMYVCI